MNSSTILKLSLMITCFILYAGNEMFGQNKIAFVTNAASVTSHGADYDSTTIQVLWDAGYVVDTLTDQNIDDLSDSASADFYLRLLAADLVIISRASSSGNYDGNSKINWTEVTTPVLINSKHSMRSSRLALLPTTSLLTIDTNIVAKFIDPTDSIVSGVTLDADSSVLYYLDNTALVNYGADSLEATTGWKLVATCDSIGKASNYIAIARLAKGVESYPESGFTPSSNWTWMTKGDANDGGLSNNEMTAAGQMIYLNEIKKMIADSRKKTISFMTNSPDGYDSTTIKVLVDNFENDTTEVVILPDANIDDLTNSATAALYKQIVSSDLVILSRATSSGNFDGASKTNWAAVPAPVMINSKHSMRSSRLALLPTTSLASLDTLIALKFVDPDDTITDGATLGADSTVLFYIDNTAVLNYGADSLETTTGWELVASCDSVGKDPNYIGIARLSKGVESYPGSGFTPNSNWTWMTKGEANDAGVDNHQMTADGEKIYLNELKKLLSESTMQDVDNTLSDLMVNGTSIDGFSKLLTSYTFNSDTVPEITAMATDASAKVIVKPASGVPGTTTVTVVGSAPKVYQIYFPATDASLSDIQISGVSIAGFDAETLVYTDSLPSGTTEVPEITVTTSDENATVDITKANTIPGTTTIVVTAENGTTQLTYEVNFELKEGGASYIPPMLSDVLEVSIVPNPVSDNATVKIDMPIPGLVRISMFDILGHEVKEIMQNQLMIGSHSIDFDTNNLSKGIYYVIVRSGNFSSIIKVVKQ